jgi:GTP-binding protein
LPARFALAWLTAFRHAAGVSGIVAIVGRPNVGKSALFNRLVGRRIAIVHDQPGVTRDRISAEAEWRGRSLTLLDTGGIGLLRGEKADDVILRAALDQVQVAIESADVVVLVVNVQEGVVPLDREVAGRLRQAGKPVLVAVNKVDHSGLEAGVTEFAELGFEQVLPVSAIHGRGADVLLAAAVALLPPAAVARADASAPPAAEAGDTDEEAAAPAEPLKLAVVGRPNVGKSSIINALTRSERVIVSPIPGTTRDSVDVPFEVETDGVRERYVLIDTAGMRKARRVSDSIEFFSVKRAEDSIERCDLVVFVLDAESGIREQDKKIADKIVAARKGCIVVVNKWDLYAAPVRAAREAALKAGARPARRGDPDPDRMTLAEFAKWVQAQMFFLDYAPVIFTSAKDGTNLDRLLEAVRYVAAQWRQRIPTGVLNRTLRDAIERRQPVSASGRRLKFFYATQTRQAPPTFLLFVNDPALWTDAYAKYLAGQLRRAFGLEGCPVVLHPRARPQDTGAPAANRRHRPPRHGRPARHRR